ncbi:hypothetical protein BCY91_12615 [Pelobium manganitolerans]|uniref:Uncharacterized protein n=1 Tax=Pelobium manganitolerans TaxID=1842495 RepID=A0A419S1X0_9SPHI|nr:hypothetical protein [Pelobium manganitolerans]RKD12481.1 hypothetical protein BCY91_12615 [Pelobium manganitolerans]
MALKFLYIDDENEIRSAGLITNLNDKETIEFTIKQPQTWNKQKYDLIDDGGLDRYDGLLLDFKLQFSDDEDSEVKYSGAELAQSIRSGVKSGSIRDIPIFLCSTEEFYISYFDRTSKDLFDKNYKKEKTLNTEQTKHELISFANAYSMIRKNKETEAIIKKQKDQDNDIQILDTELQCLETPHEIIYLLNNYFMQHSGPLIDEDLLAIRLGIDKLASKDWESLKEKFLASFKYVGILHESYPRWWQFEINNWWKETFGKSLSITSAEDRVERLIKEFDLQLIPIALPKHQHYTTFWYKCRLSNTPLDAFDGLRTIEMPRYAWQDPNYISLGYLLSDARETGEAYALLGPNERETFDELDKEN